MEFGKISDLSHVDWELPTPDLQGVLPARERGHIYLGTPAWGHREWVGKIYPPKTPAADYLHHYSRNFSTIELNTTHYRIPDEKLVNKWLASVPESFIFCPKVYQGISHGPGGLVDASLRQEWLRGVSHFGAHLGPCFLQLPPHFDYSRKAELFHFLREWPDDRQLALEFRHPSWFTPERHVLPALAKYLSERKMSVVVTDVAGRRDLLHGTVTSSTLLVRFIGNGLHPTDFTRAKDWAKRLEILMDAGVRDVFFFVHQPDDLLAPEMTDHVIREFNGIPGIELPPLAWSLLPGLEKQANAGFLQTSMDVD